MRININFGSGPTDPAGLDVVMVPTPGGCPGIPTDGDADEGGVR